MKTLRFATGLALLAALALPASFSVAISTP